MKSLLCFLTLVLALNLNHAIAVDDDGKSWIEKMNALENNSQRYRGLPVSSSSTKPDPNRSRAGYPVRMAQAMALANTTNRSAQQQSQQQPSASQEPVSDPEVAAQEPFKAQELERPESFGAWPRKSILEVEVDVRETSDIAPMDLSDQIIAKIELKDWTHYYMQPKTFAWAAPDIRYQPLYFEDVALERYGQTHGLLQQPIYSGFHFFRSTVSLPYQMIKEPPRSCEYPWGFCRPGSPTQSIYEKKLPVGR